MENNITEIKAKITNIEVVQLENNVIPEVFSSSNVDGGDKINEEFIKKYKNRIKSL